MAFTTMIVLSVSLILFLPVDSSSAYRSPSRALHKSNRRPSSSLLLQHSLHRVTPDIQSSDSHHQHVASLLRGGGGGESIQQLNDSTVTVVPSTTDMDHAAQMSLEELEDHFDTSISTGLDDDQVLLRRTQFGKNALPTASRPGLFHLILEQFSDRLVQILLCVAVVSAIFAYLETHENDGSSFLSAFVEPIVIVAILALNAIVGVWQTSSAQDSLDAVSKLLSSTATVLRSNGTLTTLNTADLVPGDIVQIRVGQKIPADARLVNTVSAAVLVDESSLTGESVSVSKALDDEGTKANMVWAGTVMTAGTATALVVATGADTKMGSVAAATTAAAPTPTPLAKQLDVFSRQLSVLIFGICVCVYVASIPKFAQVGAGNWQVGALYYAKVAVALGVAAIPEGLPAVITLTLSLACRRMAKRNVLVRKLPSMETLGCTSVICTDKTGTLTTNQMTAVSLVMLERQEGEPILVEYPVQGVGYATGDIIAGISGSPDSGLEDVAAVCALCNDAVVENMEPIGEPTEAALCVLAEKMDIRHDDQSVSRWREKYTRRATLEFSRDRKSMSVLCKYPGGNRLLVKGAPNLLLERCTHIRYRNGRTVRLRSSLRHQVEEQLSKLAKRPLRCLALAVKEPRRLERSLKSVSDQSEVAHHPLLSRPQCFRDIETGLTLVGIVGIKDPARSSVKDSINECTSAGIRVMMITGDALDTAVAIAKDVNIFPEDADPSSLKAFEGRDFFSKPEEEQLEILKTGNIVFSRTEPLDKQKLVKMLASLGEVTAMTGDGVNDAPALQQAAIGIAMGITGTEVAKEAADMVLADDDFSTIVTAVEEGRRIYANMQAFICFLISCNIGEICAIFFATVAGFPEPLTAMHLLWVNLVTDGPPATALGFNPAAPNQMDLPPRPSKEPIMTRWLLIRYCLTGAYVGFATIGVFAQHYLRLGVQLDQLAQWGQCGDTWAPPEGESMTISCAELFQKGGRLLPQTLALTTLVTMELLKALAAVSVDNSMLQVGPQANPWLLIGVLVPFLLHLAVVYSESIGLGGLGKSFGLVPLTENDWLTVLSWSLPILLVDEILKAIGRHLKRRERKRQEEIAPVVPSPLLGEQV